MALVAVAAVFFPWPRLSPPVYARSSPSVPPPRCRPRPPLRRRHGRPRAPCRQLRLPRAQEPLLLLLNVHKLLLNSVHRLRSVLSLLSMTPICPLRLPSSSMCSFLSPPPPILPGATPSLVHVDLLALAAAFNLDGIQCHVRAKEILQHDSHGWRIWISQILQCHKKKASTGLDHKF